MKILAIFVIGDLHLSICNDKPMDIFPGWDNYIYKLEKNWKKIVSPGDTVVIPGDISWGKSLDDSLEDFKFINMLPGKKIILKGNHDYWWGSIRKMQSFLNTHSFNSINILFNCAYKIDNISICGTRGWFFDDKSNVDKKILYREIGRLQRSIDEAVKLGGNLIVFLHYPPIYNNQECTPILDVLTKNNIKKCYYAHIHGKISHKSAYIGNYKGINFKLVSADYLHFEPLLVV